ncbi:MAG: MBL fold metallo-hydrolase [Planctomycetes bacterium]|nr:MBL fold metallo-hydrolase [Planctomycetota bacterium]
MSPELTFLGAARNVTGSKYLLDTGSSRVLVDCGLYQERRLKDRNWEAFPVDPSSLDAVLLTHAHLDHSGYLPRLVQHGFRGPVFGTAATNDITEIILKDSAHIQEEDARFKQKRHAAEGRKGPYPIVPLYTAEDAGLAASLLRPVEYGATVDVAPGITASWSDVGHILGSAWLELTLPNGRTVVFSGDVGRWGKPILHDPTMPSSADYLLVESTYGDRLHEPAADIDGILEQTVNSTFESGGNIVIPAFSVERSQELLYHLGRLLAASRIPSMPVFIDSPMAISVTDVFKNHPSLFDQEMIGLIRSRKSPFDLPNLRFTRERDESKAINDIRSGAVIIAGSGMCTGGRIKHHLVHNIERPECSIVFVGYQAAGTLGRLIADGADRVRIHGRQFQVRARIVRIGGFSAHADRDELLRWLSSVSSLPGHAFVTHGEESAALAFAGHLAEQKGWKTSVPEYMDKVSLD